MSRDVAKLIERAQLQARHNDLFGAIETLRQALTLEPDDAPAHAFLSMCLHDQKRLHAAEYEARAALALDPDLSAAHFAMALVAMANRKFKQAEEHLKIALTFNPEDTTAMRALARLYAAWNRRRDVLPLLEKAREVDPDDPDTWAALADYYNNTREFDRAEGFARRALEIDPQNAEALLAMGWTLLHKGRVEDAREHALLVLRNDATSENAIHLLGAVKARKSFVLGLWWRFNSYVSVGSMSRRVVILIGMYLIYRIASIGLVDLGYEQAASPLNMLWLGFCIYTWVGPGIFMRQLRKELAPAGLDSRY